MCGSLSRSSALLPACFSLASVASPSLALGRFPSSPPHNYSAAGECPRGLKSAIHASFRCTPLSSSSASRLVAFSKFCFAAAAGGLQQFFPFAASVSLPAVACLSRAAHRRGEPPEKLVVCCSFSLARSSQPLRRRLLACLSLASVAEGLPALLRGSPLAV